MVSDRDDKHTVSEKRRQQPDGVLGANPGDTHLPASESEMLSKSGRSRPQEGKPDRIERDLTKLPPD